jgi:hypothetical protein
MGLAVCSREELQDRQCDAATKSKHFDNYSGLNHGFTKRTRRKNPGSKAQSLCARYGLPAMTLLDSPNLASLNLIHPPADLNILWNRAVSL